MTRITVAGAGAFGTALAIALAADQRAVTLWARDAVRAHDMQTARQNARYLPDAVFPSSLVAQNDNSALSDADVVLLAVPTQGLRGFLNDHTDILSGATCVVCCKGIEKSTGLLPSQIVERALDRPKVAVLTGPGFASEIARGLPTALTLALKGSLAVNLQADLSTKTLRLYRSEDVVGAQLGGALKNVIAIACGIAIGAGLGESARAALMSRGYVEMSRLAINLGADPATLSGLSGLGDLALTCTSLKSRNYSLGHTLGQGGGITAGVTVEGVETAQACLTLAKTRGVEMPITGIVAAVLDGAYTVSEAARALLSRPLKSEI